MSLFINLMHPFLIKEESKNFTDPC